MALKAGGTASAWHSRKQVSITTALLQSYSRKAGVMIRPSFTARSRPRVSQQRSSSSKSLQTHSRRKMRVVVWGIAANYDCHRLSPHWLEPHLPYHMSPDDLLTCSESSPRRRVRPHSRSCKLRELESWARYPASTPCTRSGLPQNISGWEAPSSARWRLAGVAETRERTPLHF